MSEQKKRKALIVYASVTGNTEKVAMRFKQVFEKFGWQCDTLKATKKTDIRHPPYKVSDYDMLCVGGPIWSGIVPEYLYDDHRGILGYMLMPPPPSPGEAPREPVEMPAFNTGWGPKKGIAFVTYGGQGQGPIESLAALSCLELRLELASIKCVGKFACCGAQWDEPAVDPIAARFNSTVGDAVSTIARYKENPEAAEFEKLSAEDRKLFDRAVALSSEMKEDMGGGRRAWHWDFARRPHERDLLKAEIFLSEILEDYYGGGIEMYPYSQYLCIA
jgi:hypothetical protein